MYRVTIPEYQRSTAFRARAAQDTRLPISAIEEFQNGIIVRALEGCLGGCDSAHVNFSLRRIMDRESPNFYWYALHAEIYYSFDRGRPSMSGLAWGLWLTKRFRHPRPMEGVPPETYERRA